MTHDGAFRHPPRRTAAPTPIRSESSIERPLPHSIEAERNVLGAVLLDNHSLNAAVETLRVEDFFLLQNRKAFAVMIALREKNQPIETVLLMDELERRGELEAAGGAAYLSQLPDGLPRAANVEHYARIVKEKSELRLLAFCAAAIQEQALAGCDRPSEISARAREMFREAGSACRETFHSAEEMMNAPQLRFAIQNLVQLDAATIFGGLSGQGKTWVLLSIAKALLDGRGLLWDHFTVNESAERVIYLIPESTIGPFAHRLRLFALVKYVEQGKLLTRTLSKGPRIDLDDPQILAAAKGAHVFLDTIGRWSEGDENSASDNQRGLASDIFGLLGAGARSVIAAHHAPKGFSKETVMSLENCLRGSGDVGAMVGTAFGVRQIDAFQNVVHIECVKPRDFEPPGPFQLIGRPHIDDESDFRMYRKPGECGSLEDYLQPRDKGGAPNVQREAKNANKELMRKWLCDEPLLNSKQLSQRFHDLGIKLGDSAIRKYRSELEV